MSLGEAPFSVTAKNKRGDLQTIRGGSYEEFTANLDKALGAEGAGLYLSDLREAFGVRDGGQGAALSVVRDIFPQATEVPQSTVGGQPAVGGFTPPSNTVPEAPPLTPYPGDCPHGQRVFLDKPAKGKPWRRWECAIPWSPNAVGRCKAVNA